MRAQFLLAVQLYWFAQPFNALAFFPLALLLPFLLSIEVDSDPVLQVVFPGPDVLISILIDHCSLPTLKPLLEVACILTSIFECDLALALKHIFSKVPLVGLFRLSKVVGAVATELAVVEVAFVE